jgi:hypothetical protein
VPRLDRERLLQCEVVFQERPYSAGHRHHADLGPLSAVYRRVVRASGCFADGLRWRFRLVAARPSQA